MTDQSAPLPAYVPLHVHSDYSIMDGLEGVEAIAKRAAKLGMPAIALTDFGNVSGYVRFYNYCVKQGIKALMGADLDVREVVEQGERERTFRLTILPMDNLGRQNLYDLLSDAWLGSDVGALNPTTTFENLAELSGGLIILDGFRGDLAQFQRLGQRHRIARRLDFYREHFAGRFCLELTRTGREGESEFERMALDLIVEQQEKGFPIYPVASNDTVFLYGDHEEYPDGFTDYYIHDVRVSIQHKTTQGDPQLARMYSSEQYLRSPGEMAELFADLPEAILNTRAIAERCNVQIELDHPRLPRFDTGKISTPDYLRQRAHEGLEERLLTLFPDPEERERQRPTYEARLETELEVIIKMDFPGYFLIVMEFIQWSKDHGVSVGPGRGSGGGSLVAYALRITDFDPLRFDLLFERFLNPERVSMPDFDVDFCKRNRYRTVEHVKERYGRDAVSQIAAFGTMAAKAAIKDTGRALGMGYGQVDSIAKEIPGKPGTTFASALGLGTDRKTGKPLEPESPGFRLIYDNAERNAADQEEAAQVSRLIHIAMRLEGVVRNIGKHAAGVVISPTRIAEFAPMMLDSDGNPITQYDKKDVEHAGLVKFDFLGLTTLTIIEDALEMINRRQAAAGQPPVNIQAVPLEDRECYAALQAMDTTAVFQLESDGMRRLIGQMRPDRFDDLIALVALYRPGPLNSGMAESFVRRKNGVEQVCYPMPDYQDLDLKPVLDSTYGVIIYQEQVMQIAQILAGYSLGGADILRRAMGKKDAKVMAAQREIFEKGAARKGKDPQTAIKIFNDVEKFAEYGFNKSHSAAYALVAWWTLWLRVHFPAEFLAAMMTSETSGTINTAKLVSYILDCHKRGIRVNPPDVNEGGYHFTVNPRGEVVFGLAAVKGIGADVADAIEAERGEHGPFRDFFDFVQRLVKRPPPGGGQKVCLNRKALEALIGAGALDRLGPSRAVMMASVAPAMERANHERRERDRGQRGLFDDFDDEALRFHYQEAAPWTNNYTLELENRILGLYLSGHPVQNFSKELSLFCDTALSDIRPGPARRPARLRIGGVVASCEQRLPKRGGNPYYRLMLDDATTQVELSLFDSQHAQVASKYTAILRRREETLARLREASSDPERLQEMPLLVIATVTCMDGEDNRRVIRVQDIESLEEVRRRHVSEITICFPPGQLSANEAYVTDLLQRNACPCPGEEGEGPMTRLSLLDGQRCYHLRGDQRRLDPSDDLLEGLRSVVGTDRVILTYSA
ncbi:MAG: DNA polymerase III subunit alpha [Succinivibrionaceae bacterium]|nr:DNA polymerase III subunit alpha [Succinivibrionaceae bacterium]